MVWGAGGFISFSSETNPPSDPCVAPTASTLDAARDEVLEAAIALKDGTVVDAIARGLVPTDEAAYPPLFVAANLAVGTPLGVETDPAVALAAAPYLAPTEAAALCGSVRDLQPLAFEAGALRACDARASARLALERGDPMSAERVLTEAFDAQLGSASEEPDPDLIMEAGDLAVARRDIATAEARYLRATAFAATGGAAFARLAELAFDRQDLASAQTLLDLALAATERFGGRDGERFRASLRSNRGVVRLGLARLDPEDGPDCARMADVCRLAKADLDAALESDPGNWVYLLNAAWAARLTGDSAGARTLLESTLRVAPDTAPALNDLGVLEALAGDTGSARKRLQEAVALAPTYHLASWNLGVLEAGDGLLSAAGQRLLATGVQGGAALRATPIGYRLDEYVYKVDLTSGRGLELGARAALLARSSPRPPHRWRWRRPCCRHHFNSWRRPPATALECVSGAC